MIDWFYGTCLVRFTHLNSGDIDVWSTALAVWPRISPPPPVRLQVRELIVIHKLNKSRVKFIIRSSILCGCSAPTIKLRSL